MRSSGGGGIFVGGLGCDQIIRRRMVGGVAAAAAAATAIARCPTAGGITKTTEGPGDDDGDVEVRAVRVKDC